MNLKLKKIMNVVLCIAFSMALLCGCKDDKKDDAFDDIASTKECSKEEYVARITAYKEYYEEIEKDYNSVNGAILVHKNGSPYMVLCCALEQDIDKYKIMLIDYKRGKVVINGEKEFSGGEDDYGGYRACDVDIAFVNNRCVMKVQIDAGEYSTEYWEFEKDNLVAQKIGEEEDTELVDEINRSGYVYDLAKKTYEYLYSYGKGKLLGYSNDVDMVGTKIYDKKISIYDEECDIATVNKIVVPKLYDYMQLTDEQKEYFIYPKKKEDGSEIVVSDVANIYSCKVWMPLSYHRWMNGVSFKQCLNELINEPIYRIEDLMIKELNFDWYNKYSEDMTQIAVERKENELKAIEERMPKKNPYSSDEELLEMYFTYIKNTLDDWEAHEDASECKNTDLATIMAMENDFTKKLKTFLKEDYVFTSDKFKGATWKDIVYNGGTSYPTLTITKNGNVLTVPIIEDVELKEAVDAYLAYGCANWFSIEFAYIDDDNTPELISRYMDPQWEIYTYKNGAVTELKCDEINSWDWKLKEYKPKENRIILEKHGSEATIMELKIQDSKLVRIVNENPDNNQNNSADINAALQAYAELAAGYKAEAGDYYDYNGVALIYLDEDDIPEMIVDVYYYGVHNYPYSEMVTYKNGEVKGIGGVDYINGYIPKTGKYFGEKWYEESDEEGSTWLESKEVICSMDGSAAGNVPIDMFEKIKYYDDFEKALAKIK